ncbi:hypothetical protein RZS08_55245, partial [Arthrospira platensis SPKY1]|nr:hypothetical protein [Arthrospira platensis SPKY1]
LYLMNRQGLSEAFYGVQNHLDTIQQLGIHYLILHDSSYWEEERYQPYLHTLIGEHKGVWVYDIRAGKQE